MRRQLLRDIVQSIGAAIVLVALVAGLPIGLAAVRGWPLPNEIPSADRISDALGGASISDSVLLDALACLCWLAWTVLLWCAAVELLAWARGRTAARVPGAGAMQLLVRRLVVSATIVVSAARTAAVVPTVPAPVAPVLLVSTADPAPTSGTEVSAAPALPTCIVQPRDSLWRLAERHLGDPFRWREIYELNEGRTFADGGVLRDADLVQPGWQLLLPQDAVDATMPVAPPLPATESATTNAPSSSVTTPVIEVDQSPATDRADADAVDDGEDDESPVPARLATTTLLLAGVVTTITGLRRRQRRLREPGRSIRLPDAPVLSSERLIRTVADLDGAARVDIALRALGAQVVDAPSIEAVRVDGEEIEVLFAAAATGVDGPFTGEGTRVWTLARSVATADLASLADRGCVAPALVSIGRADAGDVLIDLESGGPLTVHGDRTDVTGVLWSMVLDLATHRWADDVRVIVHGLAGLDLQVLDRVEVAHDLDSALEEISFESDAVGVALRASGAGSTWHARLADLGDGWAPTIVVLGPDADAGALHRALVRLDDRPGVAVVAASPDEAPVDRERRLLVAPGGAQVALLPLDIVLQPSALPEEVIADVDELLSVAVAAEPGELLVEEASTVIDLRDQVPELPPERVIVRILGRVEIDGGRSVIDRRRVVEFVTLLALHPRGLTEGQIKAALWTEHEPTSNAFNQVVSRARTALGLDSTGQPHVRYVEGCLYKPGPELTTDWALLEAAWERTRRSRSTADVEELSDALSSLRGSPFEGTKGYEWAYELGLPSRIDAAVDEIRALVSDGRSQMTG